MDRKPEVAFVPLTKGRRLVLGFDGGCSSCLDLARRVEGAVGEKLEVQNLRVPELQAWRKEALGEDAPWAPTLFEVKGGKVLRAWIGWRMGLALTRFLGLRDTWKVMQALGEMNAAPEPDANGSLVARAAGGMSRGQFLKGVGGAAVAMSVLSTTGNFVSSASASSTTLQGDELERVIRAVAGRADSVNVMGDAISRRIRTASRIISVCQNGDCVVVLGGGDGTCRVRRVNGKTTVEGDCIEGRARRHTLRDGNTLLAIPFGLRKTQRIVSYQSFGRPRRGVKTEDKLYRFPNEKPFRVRLVSSSHNTRRDRTVSRTASEVSALSSDPCGGCLGGSYQSTCSCTSVNAVCLATACASCASCAIVPFSYASAVPCIYCAFVACPLSVSCEGNCCDAQGSGCLYCYGS